MGWIRVVLNERSWKLVLESVDASKSSALEISGSRWQSAGFRQYKSAYIDQLDIDQSKLNETFDVILAEQVWEHLKFPYRAGKNVYDMLSPGGYLYLSVPFLVRRHDDPIDCTRWTATGLKYYLEEIGFGPTEIRTFSWGNLAAAVGNLTQWTPFDPSHNAAHDLNDDPLFPVQVWGLARKSG